jgi:signal peptidase II
VLVYLLILMAFLADLLSKRWAVAFLGEQGRRQIHPWLTVRETYNEGIAFGMFQGIGPLVGWLTIAVVIGLLFYLTRIPQDQRLIRSGLALIIGGALGNLVDRITVGRVLDFLETPLRPGIFNVADMLINLGLVLIVVGSLLSARQAKAEIHPLDMP